jgi:hypothetical protein
MLPGVQFTFQGENMLRSKFVCSVPMLLALVLTGCGGGAPSVGNKDTGGTVLTSDTGSNTPPTSGTTSGSGSPTGSASPASFSWRVVTASADSKAIMPAGNYGAYQDQPIQDWLEVDGVNGLTLSYHSQVYAPAAGFGEVTTWSVNTPYEALSNTTVSARSGPWLVLGWEGGDGKYYLRQTGPNTDSGAVAVSPSVVAFSMHLAVDANGAARALWSEYRIPGQPYVNSQGHFDRGNWVSDGALSEDGLGTVMASGQSGPDGTGWYFSYGTQLVARRLDPVTGISPAYPSPTLDTHTFLDVNAATAVADGQNSFTVITPLGAQNYPVDYHCISVIRLVGTSWGTPLCINDHTDYVSDPVATIAANKNGQAIALWAGSGSSTVYAAYRATATGIWTLPHVFKLGAAMGGSLTARINDKGQAAIGFRYQVNAKDPSTGLITYSPYIAVATTQDGQAWTPLTMATYTSSHPSPSDTYLLGFDLQIDEVGKVGLLAFHHAGDHDLVEFNDLLDGQWETAQLLQKDVDLADFFINGIRYVASDKRLVAVTGQRWLAFWEVRGGATNTGRNVRATFD